MTFTEGDFLRLVREKFPDFGAEEPRWIGIGDDAAVLEVSGDPVISTDMTLEGIDFILEECGARLAGRKALARGLSDLAAMGVEPRASFLSVALPRGFGSEQAGLLLDGVAEMSLAHRCPVIGGDTKRSHSGLVIDVTVLGSTGRCGPVRRNGASPGESLYVTGELGGSSEGKHLTFDPRVSEGLRLNEIHHVTAMMDISDGLSTDLARLCDLSGTGAIIRSDSIPVSDAALRLARKENSNALDHALNDGEDYELLFTLSHDGEDEIARDPVLGSLVRKIGTILNRDEGLWLDSGGTRVPLKRGGFEHRFDGEVEKS